MTRVIQEADARKVSNVYAYVREDNKVLETKFGNDILNYFLMQAAMFLNRKFGLVKMGKCKQDQSLVIMEKVFQQNTRS